MPSAPAEAEAIPPSGPRFSRPSPFVLYGYLLVIGPYIQGGRRGGGELRTAAARAASPAQERRQAVPEEDHGVQRLRPEELRHEGIAER
jgi:hypothetical protein